MEFCSELCGSKTKFLFKMVSKLSFPARFFTFLLVLFAANALLAQSPTASLKGSIKDNKEALQGVSVVAIHKATGKQYGILTDLDGRFTLNNMMPNETYKISISYLGYQSEEQSEIVLAANEPTILDVTLKEATNILEISNVPFNRKEKEVAQESAVTGIDRL